MAIDLNSTLSETEGNHREEGIWNDWEREGGEAPGGPSEVVGSGDHVTQGRRQERRGGGGGVRDGGTEVEGGEGDR